MKHPDEGTIHAWLDGQLDTTSAAELEAHLASCARCSAIAAEARGLVASASRILAALDDVPSGVVLETPPRSVSRQPRRVTRGTLAAAAGLLLVLTGGLYSVNRLADSRAVVASAPEVAREAASASEPAPLAAQPTPQAQPSQSPPLAQRSPSMPSTVTDAARPSAGARTAGGAKVDVSEVVAAAPPPVLPPAPPVAMDARAESRADARGDFRADSRDATEKTLTDTSAIMRRQLSAVVAGGAARGVAAGGAAGGSAGGFTGNAASAAKNVAAAPAAPRFVAETPGATPDVMARMLAGCYRLAGVGDEERQRNASASASRTPSRDAIAAALPARLRLTDSLDTRASDSRIARELVDDTVATRAYRWRPESLRSIRLHAGDSLNAPSIVVTIDQPTTASPLYTRTGCR